MPKPCGSPDCVNTVSDHMTGGLCFTCEAKVAVQKHELFVELDTFLRLEAEFTKFCADNGLPNPHD